MRRKALALSLFVLALVAVVAVSQGAPPAQAQGTVPGDRIARAEYPGADNVYVVQQWCLPDGTVGIQITWSSYNLGTQWVDISHNNNGWIFGTFVGMGPLAPWETSLTPWFGIRPGAFTYIRVNTNTGFAWYPSSTIQFVTRSDCAYQPPVDSDGDGVPNNQDACPFQPGPAYNNGCPVAPPPPPPPPIGMCDPVTGWCPGQPAPASRCPSIPQIQIFPPPLSGCVWPHRGLGATYLNGEPLIICYAPNQVMWIRLQITRPDGSVIDADLDPGPGIVGIAQDDGRGNCLNIGLVGPIPPGGTRTIRFYGGTSSGNVTTLLDTETFIGP